MLKVTGLLLLACWLIVQGLLILTPLHFSYEKTLLAALALTSGVVLLMDLLRFKLANAGILMLSIWLLLRSSMILFHVHFPYSETLLAGLGIVAGVFLMVRR